MEHLLIHLAHEAMLGGPVQYRWMYLYERKLGSLKRTVRNKARVEGSIVEAHLVNELSTYCSLYFEPTIETRLNREPRNFAPDIPSSSEVDSRLSIFKVPSRRLFEKGGKRRAFTDEEMHKAHTYILLNCVEVCPFVRLFDEGIRHEEPHIEDGELDRRRELFFAKWFERHMSGQGDNNAHLKVLARGPIRFVWSHKGYFVNGYKFHTTKHGDGRVTHNSGVCVKGSCYNEYESDYYGLLDDILEVEYPGVGRCVVVLFHCTWFDTVDGVRVAAKHNLVDIKYKSRLRTDDPFVLASQAIQVYYSPYPSNTNYLKDWWAVVKTKPRGIYNVAGRVTEVGNDDNLDGENFFQENDRLNCTASTSLDAYVEPVGLVTPGSPIELDAEADFNVDEDDMDDDDKEEFYMGRSLVSTGGRGSGGRDTGSSRGHDSGIYVSSSVGGAGPNNSARHVDTVETHDFTEAEVGRKATKLLKDSFKGPWTTWRDVDSGSRAILFERFKNTYTWDDDIDGLVRLVWGAALNHWEFILCFIIIVWVLGCYMHDERDYAIERARVAGVVFDGSNYEVLIPFGPSWIHQDYWRDMVTKEQKERRKPTAIELFEMTHKTKGSGESSVSGTGQSYISRDEKFVDDYQREMIKKYGPDVSTHPLGDIEVWEHCAGGRKRGRLFGVGTCGDPSYVVTGSSSGNRSYASSSFSEVQELKEKLQKIEEERAIEREENIRMSKRLKDIEAMLARRYPPSPSQNPASRNPR
ncbi:hypothetical protein OSB04_019791 [Centaurea solstitialis]|uniref:DUF4218 domain-containing protein n=1 Tax=Centaurea solstitialis TaxID=347529 RepID=A0AA38SYM6_9ASTR|nr:hypothetical protein OSB04_019791 [Centaurea solstitialis]